MERLTKMIDGEAVLRECNGPCNTCGGVLCGDVSMVFKRLAAYEDFMQRWRLRSIEEAGRIFHRVNALGGTDLMAQYRDLGSIDHLRELAQAEKDGRLVVLPCKVGDMLFAGEDSPVLPLVVADIGLVLDGLNGWDWESLSNVGKTVFLTREEAEAALKNREEAKNHGSN